jgi:hypothetical protein
LIAAGNKVEQEEVNFVKEFCACHAASSILLGYYTKEEKKKYIEETTEAKKIYICILQRDIHLEF